MVAIDRATGQIIQAREGVSAEILAGMQNIFTLLTTPKLSRYFNRDYGSRLPDIIDLPINDTTVLLLQSEIAQAIENEFLDFIVDSVIVNTDLALEGTIKVDINLFYIPNNRFITLSGVTLKNG